MPFDQLSFGLHNNQQLFSDHYLDVILPQRPEWATRSNAAGPVMTTIRTIFDAYTPTTNEAQLEHGLVRPVLDALGHHYEVQPSLKSPDGTKTPDYVFYTDAVARAANKNRILTDSLPKQGAIAIGDAKYWDRPLDLAAARGTDFFDNRNPSYQIAFYMRHSGVEWGILTNGRIWRLYHRDSAHKLDCYYEVDLPRLLSDGNAEEFLYFAMFFSRDAFDDQPVGLRAMLRESQDYARAMGESLKGQVYDALWHLAQGFLDYPANRLSATDETLSDVYDNALILLYRLLFILYAEARALLPVQGSGMYRKTYGLYAVKSTVAEDIDLGIRLLPMAATIWLRLKELFGFIHEGNPPLKIATFNGGLFDPERHRFLDRCRVGDAHLRLAIDGIARVNGAFIDYRDLSVRHLGAIYEGLLEYRLRPMSQPDDQWTVELVNDKGERKSSGSYYTPDYIVKFIVEQTVGPMVRRAIDGKPDEAKAAAVLAVNVLDPAMGSGHFLVESTEYVARFLVDLAVQSDAAQLGETDLLHWKRRVAQSCIHGVDLNPLAVELAKLSLWLTTAAKDRPLSFLDHHLRAGNALVGARLAQLEFGGKKNVRKSKEAKNEENGQLSMMADSGFVQSMGLAVGNMWLIEGMDARTLSEVKAQEKMYDDLRRSFVAQYSRYANLFTSTFFGVEVPPDLWHVLADLATGKTVAAMPVLAQTLERSEATAASHRFLHWELEFPEVFFDRFGRSLGDRAGFDVVVGNPPYVRQEKLAGFKPFFRSAYKSHHSVADLYLYFYEQGLNLLRANGRLSYISSGTFARANFAGAFRRWLPTVARIDTLIDFGENQPFADAEMVRPSIVVLRKDQNNKPFSSLMIDRKIPESLETALIDDGGDHAHDELSRPEWLFHGNGAGKLLDKLMAHGTPLKDVVEGRFYRGLLTGLNEAFVISDDKRRELIARDPSSVALLKPFLRGEDLRPWYQEDEHRWLIFTRRGVDIDRYPAIKSHLNEFRARLEPRPKGLTVGPSWSGRKSGSYEWYELQDTSGYHEGFEAVKIIWPDISKLPRFSWGNPGLYVGNTGYMIPNAEPYLLGIMQSRAFWFAISHVCQPLRLRAGLWQYRVISQFISRLPIPDATGDDRATIGDIAIRITALARERYALHQRARSRIITDFGVSGVALSDRLHSWWTLDFGRLRTELNRVFAADVPVRERDEWEEWLGGNQAEHRRLTDLIVEFETDLNSRVYALFGLDKNEIRTIEESTKYHYGEV